MPVQTEMNLQTEPTVKTLKENSILSKFKLPGHLAHSLLLATTFAQMVRRKKPLQAFLDPGDIQWIDFWRVSNRFSMDFPFRIQGGKICSQTFREKPRPGRLYGEQVLGRVVCRLSRFWKCRLQAEQAVGRAGCKPMVRHLANSINGSPNK